MKKIILIILILASVGVLFYLASIAPYHIYTMTLTEGVDTRFLKMKPTTREYYDGHEMLVFKEEEAVRITKSLFQKIHLANFEMELPTGMPSLSMIPEIKIQSNKIRLGSSLIDAKNREYFAFNAEKEFLFDINIETQDLFLLPVFRNYLAKKSPQDIWQDIFSKKLSLPSNEGKGFKESLDALNEVSYYELVYNLYILNLRSRLLPEKIKSIEYDSESQVGLVIFEDSNNLRVERIFVLNQGIVYPISIKTNLLYPLAKISRNKFIRTLKFKDSSKDSSVSIYAEYKNLEYRERLDQKGMILLFSAWSHDLENKDYIRVIIMFLERGQTNIKYLRPFYEYAYKKFGSTFSNEKDFLIESGEEKLKRKMTEELELEQKIEANKKTPIYEGQIDNQDEKIKSMLIKAKESKVNSDDKVMELNMD
jgi:hypothetical protein